MLAYLLPVLGLVALLAGVAALSVAGRRARRPCARCAAGGAELDEDPQARASRTFVSLARRIQALANRQLRELREMESRHGADAGIFGDLLHLDHGTALIGRFADSLAVLGGDRPGRRWNGPIPLLGVLRGAMSRIIEYRRVDIGPLPEGAALRGEFAEPLIHALAELLDNATRYSPPDSRVEVNAYAAAYGLVIEIVDAGVGMGARSLADAERTLRAHGAAGFERSALDGTPRLGFAVVGRLARTAGFGVALGSSSRGGVRAVLRIPPALLAEHAEIQGPVTPTGAASPRDAPAPMPSAHRAPEIADTEPADRTAQGLPKRRRHVPEPATPPAASAPGQPAGLWLGAFHAALRGDENGARR